MRTAALVGPDASIDWFCLPRFDSPSIFAAILDDRRGGRFRLHAVGADHDTVAAQYYWPDTNILITRFRSRTGGAGGGQSDGVTQPGFVGEVIDFMPIRIARHNGSAPDLIRIARAIAGHVRFRVDCSPAFDYARRTHTATLRESGALFECGDVRVGLSSTMPLTLDDGRIAGEVVLPPGEATVLALQFGSGAVVQGRDISVHEAMDLLEDTGHFWRGWLSHCTYQGRWRERVYRSALALKLLTYEPTGAIVAAPTCSLPENIGGTRNWDYRYTWMRDAAFTVFALLRIGLTREAQRFMEFLRERSHELESGGMLRPLYGVDGRHFLPEETLDHLSGYEDSRPVRIGNAAHTQLQLDIYGTVMDAAYLSNKHASPLSHDLWTELRKLLNWVCDNWQHPDNGVWEVRGPLRNFVYSKLQCWVALDRGLRIASARSFPSDSARWRAVRDRIYEEIMTRGWDTKRGAFVQHYDTDQLDACNLLMPTVLFISPTDPRLLSTLRQTELPLSEGGLLSDFMVNRYNPTVTDDGIGEPEGAFNMCTFWLVEALTKAGRTNRLMLERARLLFERMLWTAGPLGLYAEQTGFDGRALGNYPQALTHLSLITAAYHLDKALGNGV